MVNSLSGPTIWAIFSVDNNYDQPDANLVAWWPDKPKIEVVGSMIAEGFPCRVDEHTLAVVKVWSGEEARIGETNFRLEQISSGAYVREIPKGKAK